MANKVRAVFRREAGEVKRYRVVRKIISLSVAALATLLIVLYLITVLYSNYGSFTVTVAKFDSMNYSVTLSEDPTFVEYTGQLNAKASENITNISGASIPLDVDAINGLHSGDNYLAYTFYCKNNGRDAVNCTYELFITNITLNLDKAVRVRLYEDGEAVTYARTASDGSGAEEDTVEFQSGNTIVKKEFKNFEPDDVKKFTIVIWIEGDDPDCTDDKIGGEFKIGMTVNITGLAETENNS